MSKKCCINFRYPSANLLDEWWWVVCIQSKFLVGHLSDYRFRKIKGLSHHPKTVVVNCLWSNHCPNVDPPKETSGNGVYASRETVAYLNIGAGSAISTSPAECVGVGNMPRAIIPLDIPYHSGRSGQPCLYPSQNGQFSLVYLSSWWEPGFLSTLPTCIIIQEGQGNFATSFSAMNSSLLCIYLHAKGYHSFWHFVPSKMVRAMLIVIFPWPIFVLMMNDVVP